MTAAEARDIVNKGGDIDNEKLEVVYKIIEEKAKIGLTIHCIEETFGIKPIIHKLREDGFKCTLSIANNSNNCWQIEW